MVSGGADSLCLLHALVAVHDGPVGVLSVDHGLRPEAAHEVARVRDIASALGCQATVVPLRLEAGSGVQERAREARYAAAREVAAAGGWNVIAVGHTSSDQAETVLMRLARGTGRTGALGMAPRRGDLVRPLLCVEAAETAAWCHRAGIVPVDDPSNQDAAYTRVRARALVAQMECLHPQAARQVSRFADLLRDEHEVLGGVIEAAWARCAQGGSLDITALVAEPAAMQRLLVRRLLAEHGLGGDALGGAAIHRVLGVVGGGSRTEVVGAVVVRERNRVVVQTQPVAEPSAVELAVPGAVRFGERVIRGRHGRGAPPERGTVALACTGRISVRGPRPGDRLALEGGGHARVGRILQSDGVPARLRPLVPVVIVDDVPVWVAGHRVCAGALAEPGQPAVVLEVFPA
jgi:tRNA(Ile)-lysidine synthase